MRPRVRFWLPAAICIGVYLALVLAQYEGAFARRLNLTGGYLGHCSSQGRGFRCSGAAGDLKSISIPIRLKVNRDYRVSLRGRSLGSEPAIVYVDFFGDNYNSPEQKGQVLLLPGVATTHVLRWPSGWPPASALLRISNREGTDFEIASIEVAKGSRWIPRLRVAAFYSFWVLFAVALWRDRRDLLASHPAKPGYARFAHPDLLPLLLLASAVAVFLLVRVATMAVPMVFGDEMSYALLSSSLGDPSVYWRNTILKPLPNQLFFDVYHLATLSGEAALACARAMNCVLFALTALPVFALSRKVLPRAHAYVATAIILLLPNNSCTAFFMPEAFYFLCFYVVAWAFVSLLEPVGRLRDAAIAGFSLAALSLIKPHGLTVFVVCNVVLLAATWRWAAERARLGKGWAVLLLVFLAARALLGVSAAPAVDATFFDRTFGLYAELLRNTLQLVPDSQALHRLELAAIDNIGSLLLLFGAPLVVSAAWLTRSRAAASVPAHATLDRLHLFSWTLVAVLLAGTIKFTAYIAGADPNQDPGRIHERYYDFSFGLLLIGAYASLRAVDWDARRARIGAALAAVPAAAVALWYLTHQFANLRPALIDHPILMSVWWVQDYGVAFLALVFVLATLLVPVRGRLAGCVYGLALGGLTLTGLQAVWSGLAGSQTLWENDRAALALKVLYTPAELERGLVVGDDLEPLSRTSFYLRGNVAVRKLPERSVIDAAKIVHDPEWVLAYGDYQLVGNWDPGLKLPARATLFRAAHVPLTSADPQRSP